ncbi:hypothetical protein GWI33_010215 [Rhynchophorus ferrugineus]|uniref:Uncharacterized protein n=1 Tax=Rhynchophorus ferrugineus TaxID=354439 RepID=A0A834IM20_RHYFE|nr:hypothetical protein GWI33_010215 [Rhynchophorus ferrugineus]
MTDETERGINNSRNGHHKIRRWINNRPLRSPSSPRRRNQSRTEPVRPKPQLKFKSATEEQGAIQLTNRYGGNQSGFPRYVVFLRDRDE